MSVAAIGNLAESLREDAEQLAEQLRRVADRSRYYAERWDGVGREAVRACTAADATEVLASLPLTTKDDLRRAQEAEPPFGSYLACDPSEVALVHRTSGTTGRPLLVAATTADSASTSLCGGRSFSCAGLMASDVVVHCLNYSMWAGGYTDHRCLEAAGAAVVPFGVGNTEELISLQSWLPFTALSGTPSYVRLLLERLTGADLDRWRRNVRLFLVGGEPGGSEAALQQRVAEELDAKIVNANYGLAEVLSNFGSECEFRNGMHFHGHGEIWLELLDAEGRSQKPGAGVRGEVVLTHLRRQSQPLVRYQTKDVMEIIDTDRCPCGRESFRFELHGRADDMFVVRGINVFPGAVARALTEVSPRLTEFAILLPASETFDRIPLVVEGPIDAASDIGERIENAVKHVIGCGSEVTMLAPGTLPRTHGKTRRLYHNGEKPPLPADG